MIQLSLESPTEGNFERLFDSLPEKCIVFLEDIDSTGITRDIMRNDKKGRSGISLSGLLNTIDGSTSAEGGLLIVRSNTPDSLDPALVRGGRIDRKILFDYASKEVSESIFVCVFTLLNEEEPRVVSTQFDHKISVLAAQFARIIPYCELPHSDLQAFLFKLIKDPVVAVGMWRNGLPAISPPRRRATTS